MKIKHPFRLLYFVSFFFSIQYGLVVYINSSFLESSVGEKWIGLLFALASLLSIIVLLEMPKVLSRLGNYKTTILVVLCNAISLLFLATIRINFIIVISFILYTISNYCLLLVRDVFIEDYTKQGAVGRTRGIFLTIVNIAMVLAPSLAVFLVAQASYTGVYILGTLCTLASLFFIFPQFKNFKDPVYHRVSVRATFRKIMADKHLRKIYFSQFLLCFFYSWMVIYMPIYLHHYIGFTWQQVGLIFSIMLVPFVLVDYPLGRISDKIGEKKILIIGFFILSLSTMSILFIHTPNLLLWALVLFISRIGAATVEIMCESYFFKKINPSDSSLISMFRNIFPLAFIIAPLCAILILFFIPTFNYLFFFLGAFIFAGLIANLKLRDLK